MANTKITNAVSDIDATGIGYQSPSPTYPVTTPQEALDLLFEVAEDLDFHGIVPSSVVGGDLTAILSINGLNNNAVDIVGFHYFINSQHNEFPGVIGLDISSLKTPGSIGGILYMDSNQNFFLTGGTALTYNQSRQFIQIGRVQFQDTASTVIVSVASIPPLADTVDNSSWRAFALGTLYSGEAGLVSKDETVLQLQASPGDCLLSTGENRPVPGSDPISFLKVYSDGAAGWTIETVPTSTVPLDYDDGSGTPAAIPVGKFAAHTLLRDAANGVYYLVLGDTVFDTQAEAEGATVSAGPIAVNANAVITYNSLVVVDQAGGIISTVIDQRPVIGGSGISVSGAQNASVISYDNAVSNLTASNVQSAIDEIVAATYRTNTVYVESLNDLPDNVGGAITLETGKQYLFGDVDLAGNRLVANGIVAISGSSSETARIKSTGLNAAQPGQPLLTTNSTIPIRNITLDGLNEGYPILSLDAVANPGSALDWYGVNIVDAPDIGTIANYSNAIFLNGAFINSANLEFDGTFDTIAADTFLLTGRENQSTVRVLSTCTINRRLRMIYSSIVTPTGGIGLNLESATSFPNPQSAILDNIYFSGAGTPTSAVLVGTNKGLYVNCVGIPNINSEAVYYMEDNVTATTITVAGTYYKIAGTTTIRKFINFIAPSSNQAKFQGATENDFFIGVTANLSTSTNNRNLAIKIFRDDGLGNFTEIAGSRGKTRATTAGQGYFVSAQTIAALTPDDSIEIRVTNLDGTEPVTAQDLAVVIHVVQ